MMKRAGAKKSARVAGTALLVLGLLMFVNAFVAAVNAPLGPVDIVGCRPNAACDAGMDMSNRQAVFFSWLGASSVVLVGGGVLRWIGNRE